MAGWFDQFAGQAIPAAQGLVSGASAQKPPMTTMAGMHQLTPDQQMKWDALRARFSQHPGFFSNLGNKMMDMAQSGVFQQLATPQGRLDAYQARFQQHPNDMFSRLGNATINYAQQNYQPVQRQAPPLSMPNGPLSSPVLMRAPDGTQQAVDPAHVQHYQGLGAHVVNGSSY